MVRTVPVAAVLSVLLASWLEWQWALCFGLSALWGAVNLWLLSLVVDAVIFQKSWQRGLLLLPPKLLCLAGGAAAIVTAPFFSPLAFLAGFHLVFAVIAAELIRQMGFGRPAREELA